MSRYNNISQKEATIESIPQGIYCYDEEGLCPYWSIDKDHLSQENGYCHFLKKGDWEMELGLIWDQCKECNIFTEINEYDWTIKTDLQRFIVRFSLWPTIQKSYNIKERIKILFTGKICRCKFCRKYFLQPTDASNVTQCFSCFCESVKRNNKRTSKEFLANE